LRELEKGKGLKLKGLSKLEEKNGTYWSHWKSLTLFNLDLTLAMRFILNMRMVL